MALGQRGRGGNVAKILIADDSDMMRKIAKMIMEKAGHTVIEAHDGNEAVALAKNELPNLVLLDAEMPEMDGRHARRSRRILQPLRSPSSCARGTIFPRNLKN